MIYEYKDTVLEQNRISKPVCLTDLVPVKFALDLIIYFEYSIIEEYVILIPPISNQLALSMIDFDVLGRIHKV